MGKQKLSFNKDFADNLIISSLFSYSIEETLIKEIKQIPSNAFIVINIKLKQLKVFHINYAENSIPMESEEGLKIIDDWIDKWGYIFRSLKKQTNYIFASLSGGFDTRTMIPILLNSGVSMDELNIYSIQDSKHDHDVDFKIATNISLKYGFKINNFHLDKNVTKFSLKDTIFATIYSKLGFHKEFYLKEYFYNKPRFAFTGSGGEFLRGYPNTQINNFIKKDKSNTIVDHQEEFYNSSFKIYNRSISFLKEQKTFNNDYEITSNLYCICSGKNHFGKAFLENFLSNSYTIQPLMDPDIRKIKFDVNNRTSHDLIAYIMVRFAHHLIYFPFQGNRTLNLESIKKAERLNINYKPYKRKLNFNKNFYIDRRRISPVNNISQYNGDPYEYLNGLFKSSKYINIINKIYDKNVYDYAYEYSCNNNYHPLRHHYALLAIAITFNNLQLNERFINNKYNDSCYNLSESFIDLNK